MSTYFHSTTLQQKFYSKPLNVADLLSCKLTYARLDAGKAVKDVVNSRNRLTITSEEVFEENSHVAPAQIQNISSSRTVVTPDVVVQTSSLEGGLSSNEVGSLKKLDIGNYWNTLDTDNSAKEVSSLSRHIQLDTDSLGPSLSQEQLFSISDFALD